MKTHPQTPSRPDQVLHGLGELVAYTPYLLGFHPTESLVVLGSGRGSIGPTSRVDAVEDPAGQRAVAEIVVGQMTRARPEWHEVLLFGDTQYGRKQARDLVSRLRRECAPVRHLIVVRPSATGGPARWQLASCRCGRGCRTGWHDVPDLDRIPAVADRVLEGSAPARDRAELVAALRPRPLVTRAVLTVDRPVPTPERYAQSLLRVLDVGDDAEPVERLPVTVLAEVLDGIADAGVRDHLLGWLVPHTMRDLLHLRSDLTSALRLAGGEPWPGPPLADPERTARMEHRLRALVTCAPEQLVPAPAAVLGYWCWAHGGGALATIALERALEARPGYYFANLLMQVVQHGLRPDDLTRGGDVTG